MVNNQEEKNNFIKNYEGRVYNNYRTKNFIEM